jgi:UDP-N-acetylglucosamine:LPS N-acetylglucosamine transferase
VTIVPLSIKHILIECPNYMHERNQILGSNNLRMTNVLNEEQTNYNDKLYMFLRNIDIFEKI